MKLHIALVKVVDARSKVATAEPVRTEDHMPKSVFDFVISHSCLELQHMVQLGQSSGTSNTEGLPQSVMKLDLVCPFDERRGTVPCNRLP
mmetsp:Transcript_51658/g.77264  ORF Transcript_51658/g.77264 Transcript_51658/m.77264 type:complete len:90 (+) Transcript_51658:209-478(+)